MIVNTTNDSVLCQRVVEASSFFGRMRGMLSRDFSDFDAMLFRKNNSIHMFFMAMPLDIVFLDTDDRVLSMRHSLKPWRLAADMAAAHVLELPSGTIKTAGLVTGDMLDINADQTV